MAVPRASTCIVIRHWITTERMTTEKWFSGSPWSCSHQRRMPVRAASETDSLTWGSFTHHHSALFYHVRLRAVASKCSFADLILHDAGRALPDRTASWVVFAQMGMHRRPASSLGTKSALCALASMPVGITEDASVTPARCASSANDATGGAGVHGSCSHNSLAVLP